MSQLSNEEANGSSGSGKVKLIKWAIIIAGVAIAAPAALFILKGVIALVTAGVIGLGAIYFAPVVAMKFANQKVKMIVQEAQANPIETLINQLAEKRQAAQKFADSITAFRTEVKNFESKTELFEKQYLEAQLLRFGGNISRTANFVGMERSALHRKLKFLGVHADDRVAASANGG